MDSQSPSRVSSAHEEIERLTTRIRDLEAERGKNEARYGQLIEKMNQGFVATDAENRFTLVNQKMVELLSYSRAELQGRYLGDFVEESQRGIVELQENQRRGGAARPYELVWQTKDGREVETVVSPTPLFGSDESFQSSFAVITDVTERNRAEEERRAFEERLLQSQKLESLGRLASGIAHDFNNLLVGILGNAGLALADIDNDSTLHPLLSNIETAAVRAAELTRQILAYSGKGKFVPELVDLAQLVEEMVHLLDATISTNAELTCDFGAGHSIIEGDATQIRQVVMNLITNASDALADGEGAVRISTRRVEADKSYLARAYLTEYLREGPYLMLEVADDGCGMDEATRQRIFDPFFTTKEVGHGLGLAAVLGIVRSHRGFVEVESEPDRGTAFRVHFPVRAAGGESLVEGVAEPRAVRGSGWVLAADDEAAVLQVAQASLERAGFSVVTARDGREAVELFERHADKIQAVLLDVNMPRMSGEEAFRAIRELSPGVKVILTSGYTERSIVAGRSGEGLAGFLQKPFRPTELTEMVRDVLGL